MKKVLLSLLCVITLSALVGCGSKENIVLDLAKIEKELDNLSYDKIDVSAIDPDSMNVYGELDFVYDFDFESKFGLDSGLIKEYNVFYNEETKELLAIFEPMSGKMADVKSQMIEFANSVNADVQELGDILVYIASKDNNKVLNIIKNKKVPVFGGMVKIDDENIKEFIGVDASDVEEYLIKTPMMMTQSNTYLIVKPKKGKEASVKEALNNYMTKLENQWATYLPDQYELVKNRKVEQKGDYLIYIVSKDNDLVFSTINK